jgi:formate hydrogenlyase subunit 3/multisubunit Na+/H+ antiporter MnhD subunit
MYFGSSRREHGCDGGWGAQAAMLMAAALVLLLGVFPGPLTSRARRAELLLARPAVNQSSILSALRAQ